MARTRKLINTLLFILLLNIALFSASATSIYCKSLYVSTAGNDGVSYEDNDMDHPWATPEQAWMQARAGDTVYFREGTYYVTETINTKYTADNGTADSPIIFTRYESENVVISGDTGGGPIFIIEKSYNHIDTLTLRGGNFSGGSLEGSVIVVGWDLPADHFKITNSTIEVYQSNTYSNNASIRINSSASNFAEVSDCVIIGDGGTTGIQIFRTQGVTIKNNEFRNCGLGVYLKHSNALDPDPAYTNHVVGNYFHNLTRPGVYGVFNYSIIKNNLLVNCGIALGDDGGIGDGWVGADYNTISHNTLYNSAIVFEYQGREEDPNKGCRHNIVKDNILMGKSLWHAYNDIEADIQSDFNLYPDTGDIVYENRINYTLTQWQLKNNSDASSLTGTPIFAGGSSPSSISEYMLSPGSPGKNAASDHTDMGADISAVGIQNNETPDPPNPEPEPEDPNPEPEPPIAAETNSGGKSGSGGCFIASML